MIVCGHGDVYDFCEERNMVVADLYNGEVAVYDGICRILVTDQEMSENEYLTLKKKMLVSGVELVSTKHVDETHVSKYIVYSIKQDNDERRRVAGRCLFGYHRVNGEVVPHEEGMKVVRRIFELRDENNTYAKISKDDDVHGLDGRKLSISTIALIIKNRERYGL